MEKNVSNNADIIIGVVGLGLMGCSICTCLLIAGHRVIAVAPIPDDLNNAEKRIRKHLDKSHEEGMAAMESQQYFKNLVITEDYNELANCALEIECTVENIDIKKSVYAKIESVISP